MTRESARRVIRTFGIAFLGVALPGTFGWLHALTEWARAEGQTPFPDARSLAFLGVAAIVAGVIALLNLVVVWVEDAAGRGILRDVPSVNRVERGHVSPVLVALVCGVVALVVLVVVSPGLR